MRGTSHAGHSRGSPVTFGTQKMITSPTPRRRTSILGGFIASAMLCLLGALVIAKHRFRSVELSPKTALILGCLFCALGLSLAFGAVWALIKKESTDESKATN